MMKKTIFAMLWALWLAGSLMAQTTLQVVTKNITKSVGWTSDMAVVVNCEKSEIVVQPVDSGQIQIVAELSARHPSLEVATGDIEAWKWTVDRIGNKLYIRAYIGVKPGSKPPASDMKARLVIKAPRQCQLDLTNRYGKVLLNSWEGDVKVAGSFCELEFEDMQANLNIDVQYSQLRSSASGGQLTIQSKRSDLNLKSLAGTCRIKAEHGQITIVPATTLNELKIDAAKSAIILLETGSLTHKIEVTTQHGVITVPNDFVVTTLSAQTQHGVRATTADPPRGTIEAQTNYADIIVSK
jgi:Putative adhesin